MRFQKYLHVSHAALQSVFRYRNFPLVWLNYLGLISGERMEIRLWNGIRYAVRTKGTSAGDAYIVNEIWLYGVHAGLRETVRDAAVGIDIGAHIGVFSVAAAMANPSLKVYAFEPVPDNFNLLQENVRLNGLGGRIVPVAAAVAGTAGRTRDLHLVARAEGLCTINPSYLAAIRGMERYGLRDKLVSSVRVEAVSLETVFRERDIGWCDFIKMDCEGAEYEILFSAPAHVLQRIGVMSVEYHYGGDFRELARFLERHGFSVSFPHPRLDVMLAKRPERELRRHARTRVPL